MSEMYFLALALGSAVSLQADDAYTVTIRYKSLHCDECKSEAEAVVKRAPGFVSAAFDETSAQVKISEKSPPPAFTGLPKDMKVTGTSVALRGTASVTGDKVVFVAKGSGAALGLTGPAAAELRKAAGGKNRFLVTGALVGRAILLEDFKAVDW